MSVLPGIFRTNLDAEQAPQQADMKHLFSVDTLGGTGKTFEISALQQYIKSKGLKVLTLLSSAVVAQLFDGDLTVQSAPKIRFQVHHLCMISTDVNPALAVKLCSMSLFMSDKNMITRLQKLEAVERIFRDLMRSILPYGSNHFPLSRRF